MQTSKSISKPINEKPSGKYEIVRPKKYIILEGTVDFRNIADVVVFVYASDETLIQRRLKRDLESTGITSFDKNALEDYIRNKSIPKYKKHTTH